MMRRLLLLLVLACAGVPFASAQQGKDDINLRPGLKEGFQMPQAEQKPAEGKPFPVPAAIVAAGGTLLILMILCTPSRRQ